MNDPKPIISSRKFLFDGGETGELIRSLNWSTHPLGDPETWQQSLRTSVNICLDSKAPMAIWWGKSFVHIYNDAFSSIHALRHPSILGADGKDVWPEKWSDVGIVLASVLEEARTITSLDETFLIRRNGIDEQWKFTFVHSPIYDESGAVGGVMTSITEMTRDVSEKISDQPLSAIAQAPVAIAILKGPDFRVTVANEKMLELWGKTVHGVMHKTLWQVFPDQVGKGLEPLLKNIYLKGGSFKLDEVPIPLIRNGVLDEFYTKVIYQALRDSDGNVEGIMVIADEITEQVIARKVSEQNESRLRMAVESTELGTWDFNPLTGELSWSEECQKIYALPPGQKVDFATFSEHIHPDDKKYVTGEIEKSMDPSGNGSYDITYRIIRFTDKSVRWIRAQGKVYFNSQKQPERFIGTVVDTTREKERNVKLIENELRMRLAIEASEMGTYDWDIVNSNFQYSERLANIFGFRDNLLLKQSDFSDRIHPDDRAMRLQAHDAAFKTGVLFYEARIIWPDGSEHWVRLNGQLVFDADGHAQRMYGTTLDITEQKNRTYQLEKKVAERTFSLQKKNEELKRSEERYHKMTEEVKDYAIILLDSDGHILNWNQGAEKIKGYKQGEILGKSFTIFYLDEDRKNKLPEKLIAEAAQNGRAMQEGLRKRKDGTTFWGSIVITALHDDQNNVIGFSKVTRDLTERKIAEDRMKQYTAELVLRNQELEQFAYIASHDLQEPLRKIQTFAEMLEKNVDDRVVRQKYFDKINSSAKRMGELITSVLNYSRLANSESLFHQTDLNIILEGVKSDYELLIEERKAIIKSDRLPTIKGVTLQLSQLFANLISNSLKFSNLDPVIEISATIFPVSDIMKKHPSLHQADNYVELIFRDNGIGFEQQYADKIFTIFQRLNRREDYAGTGIGLALCKKIVDNHQGLIQAKSQLGAGAEFYIYLPL